MFAVRFPTRPIYLVPLHYPLTPCLQPLVPRTSILFVSQASIKSGIIKSYDLRKRIEAVKSCRNIGKKDMKYNDLMPKMRVHPETDVSTPRAPAGLLIHFPCVINLAQKNVGEHMSLMRLLFDTGS